MPTAGQLVVCDEGRCGCEVCGTAASTGSVQYQVMDLTARHSSALFASFSELQGITTKVDVVEARHDASAHGGLVILTTNQ